MRPPYKVIVWGPGAVGRGCMREMLKRPEFELVGVLGFSPDKIGKDVGELLGQNAIGVKVTADKEWLLALPADCVLYTAAYPLDSQSMESDLIRILESGKNVVSATSHHFPQAHGDAYMARLNAACLKGGSSIHGTGENSGFWFERVALTLTAACNEVKHLHVEEFVDCASGGSTAETLYPMGFDMTVAEAQDYNSQNKVWQEYYFQETLSFASWKLFNRLPDKIERTSTFWTTDREIVISKAKGDPMDMYIGAGKVHAMTHKFVAYLDGVERLVDQTWWCLKLENSPFALKAEHYWRIRLDGRPVSLDCEFTAFATLEGREPVHPVDRTPMTWYLTSTLIVQAIPVVCAAKPGAVLPEFFTHATPDLRLLEKHRT